MEAENKPDENKRAREPPALEKTPEWLVDYACQDFPIDFYPEADLETPLIKSWRGFSFVHPPHAEAELWVKKAVLEMHRGNHSVLLLPAVFNSVYWREIVYPQATEIRVLTCPVKLPGAKKQIVSQMSLVVFAGRSPGEELSLPPIYPVEPPMWRDNYYIRARNRARFSAE